MVESRYYPGIRGQRMENHGKKRINDNRGVSVEVQIAYI